MKFDFNKKLFESPPSQITTQKTNRFEKEGAEKIFHVSSKKDLIRVLGIQLENIGVEIIDVDKDFYWTETFAKSYENKIVCVRYNSENCDKMKIWICGIFKRELNTDDISWNSLGYSDAQIEEEYNDDCDELMKKVFEGETPFTYGLLGFSLYDYNVMFIGNNEDIQVDFFARTSLPYTDDYFLYNWKCNKVLNEEFEEQKQSHFRPNGSLLKNLIPKIKMLQRNLSEWGKEIFDCWNEDEGNELLDEMLELLQSA